MNEAKPLCISKWEVWEAYKRVKANKGAAGVDEESIGAFRKEAEEESLQDLESDVVGQLLSATCANGENTEANGGERKLGIPTVSDRIAQTVVQSSMEPVWNRCSMQIPTGIDRGSRRWMRWVKRERDAGGLTGFVDLDIRSFFDNLDQDPSDAGGEETR